MTLSKIMYRLKTGKLGTLDQKFQELRDARDELREEMKQLYNLASFDWETMPESGRKKFRELVLESAEKCLKMIPL